MSNLIRYEVKLTSRRGIFEIWYNSDINYVISSIRLSWFGNSVDLIYQLRKLHLKQMKLTWKKKSFIIIVLINIFYFRTLILKSTSYLTTELQNKVKNLYTTKLSVIKRMQHSWFRHWYTMQITVIFKCYANLNYLII